MMFNVPREILIDVFGFLSRKDLDSNLFVSKAWCKIIEASEKQLPQRQEIKMKIYDRRKGQFTVDFSNGDKTIRLTEKVHDTKLSAKKKILIVEGRKDVEFTGLKNRFVAGVAISDGAQFQNDLLMIKNLVGGQIMLIKNVALQFCDSLEVPDLTLFRHIFSCMFLF